MFRNYTANYVCLSLTEVVLTMGVTSTHDILYIMRVQQSQGLKVKLPMSLEMDYKSAVDLDNNWSVGLKRHIDAI